MLEKITIFTDGSSRGNPGPGGFGAVVVGNDFVQEIGGRENHTTNNRMELLAVISALSFLDTITLSTNNYQLLLYSDSRYVINGATKWIFGWQKNGWITSQKKEVENQDLWERLFGAMRGKKIDWRYVGGHIGVSGNERCDEIATAFADNTSPKLYTGSLVEYPIKNILSVISNPALASTKEKSGSRSKATAYSYVSSVNGVVQTHKTWAECEKRVKGVSGTRFKKALNPAEEQDLIRQWSTK
ncbi:MAG: hypothetical protein RLZZ347_531 [Candidatus Parcubacteria bacterium]|jgi:ribonuclease HI